MYIAQMNLSIRTYLFALSHYHIISIDLKETHILLLYFSRCAPNSNYPAPPRAFLLWILCSHELRPVEIITSLKCTRDYLCLIKEEVAEEATEFWDGSVNQEYNCSYCGRVKRKTIALTFKVKENASETSRLIANPLANNKEVEAVKIEIFSNKGDTKMFNFQNVEQAQKFLEEFDFEKIED